MNNYIYPLLLIHFAAALPAVAVLKATDVQGDPWTRHTIDNTSDGADGARPMDINGDGWMDFVTPWEEGGAIRVYLHPGPELVRETWPNVTVGNVDSPEDAVFADLDRDGWFDVISATEGENKTIYIHWAPAGWQEYLQPEAWETRPLPASKQRRQWMFTLPLNIDHENGLDIFAGSKNDSAALGWFEAPADARHLDFWKWHPLRTAAWTMSLIPMYMNDDNLWDVAYSERRGQYRGLWYLLHPGLENRQLEWPATRMGGHQHEVMFMAVGNLDEDEEKDFIAATSGGPLLRCELAPPEKQRAIGERWLAQEIDMPPNAGKGKAVAVADVDNDGAQDIVVSCEHAEEKHGVFWLAYHSMTQWNARAISGLDGVKFDLVVMEDLDKDGDLDLVTCEENENLGVVWYENPYGPKLLPLDTPPEAGSAPDAEVHVETENQVIQREE